MARKCYISFKAEDLYFKNYIQTYLNIDMIDKSLNSPINSSNFDYIMRKIREDYLSDSTVTIHLIGNRSAEYLGEFEQRFIKSELQASLFHGEGNSQNGILGIVLPLKINTIFGGVMTCPVCGKNYNYVRIDDSTVVKEFSHNYYLPTISGHKCSWNEDERYCILTSWDNFISSPEIYIENAYQKRLSRLSELTIVRP